MKFKLYLLILIAALFYSTLSIANAEILLASSDKGPEDNGIRLNDFKGFEDNWKLVTVHYRTDTAQIRFVYANPIAYEALVKGSTDYPDGAVFAKIAVASEDDPAFIDSKIPSGALRDQLMVRDKIKYAASGGWGFAYFPFQQPAPVKNPSPVSIPKHGQKPLPEPDTKDACFACHQIVKDRGYVFSFPARLKGDAPAISTNLVTPVVSFSTMDRKKLPENIRALIPSISQHVRILQPQTPDPDHLVYVGEFRPILINEARRSDLPALFYSNAGAAYIIVTPLGQSHLPDGTACAQGQKAFETYGSEVHNNINKYFCQ